VPPYRYYAGFSEDFVRDIINASQIGSNSLLLDPWNGSGTTTRVAAQLGVNAVGIDLNPAMAVLAKARLLQTDEGQVAARLLAGMAKRRPPPIMRSDDPLLDWFDARSAALIRGVERHFQIGANGPLLPVHPDDLSIMQAHLYAALFLAVRALLQPFTTTNPTWVRKPKPNEAKLHVNWDSFQLNLLRSALVLQADALTTPVARQRIAVKVGSSISLPNEIPKASLVITSPPYCTRIDYAVATRPELAVMGLDEQHQNELRRELLGTTTVPRTLALDSTQLGWTALSTLRQVLQHHAKASKTYYYKWLVQYLLAYQQSLSEISSHVTTDAILALVVQGSFYKDIEIDLPLISQELLTGRGWCLAHVYQFRSSVTMAGVNPRTRVYRSDFSATEEVLIFHGKHEGEQFR